MEIPNLDSFRMTMKICRVGGTENWISEFANEESSFLMCLALGVFANSLILKNSEWTQRIEKLFIAVEQYAVNKKLNCEFFKNFSSMLSEVIKHPRETGFSFTRYYFESKNPDIYLSLEYGIKFIIAYGLSGSRNDWKILGKSEGDWDHYLIVYCNLLGMNVLVNDQGSFQMFGKENQFSFTLLKKNKNFVYVFDHEYFNMIYGIETNRISERNLNSERLIGESYSSLITFGESKIIDQRIINDLEEDEKQMTRRSTGSKKTGKQILCRVKYFLKFADVCLAGFNLPPISDYKKISYLKENNIIKVISLSEISLFLSFFFPEIIYSKPRLISIIKQSHISFKVEALSKEQINYLTKSLEADILKNKVISSLKKLIRRIIKIKEKKCARISIDKKQCS